MIMALYIFQSLGQLADFLDMRANDNEERGAAHRRDGFKGAADKCDGGADALRQAAWMIRTSVIDADAECSFTLPKG